METQLARATQAASEPVRTRRARPLRVVIVEDSERILSRLAEDLSTIENVRIAGTAATEDEALRILSSSDWDLVILDLQLKQGNGLRVLKALQADERIEAGTIAVFTNYAFSQYRDRSVQLGADYFFDKSREFGRVLRLARDMASRG